MDGHAFTPPQIHWEFVHPELPIVRVAALYDHYDIVLPYSTQQRDEETAFLNAPTFMTIEFVIAFQHRWTSFSDPNRWAIKFKDDLKVPEQDNTLWDLRLCGENNCTWKHRNGALDPKMNSIYPNYWHTTDYMQHSLIGPVVLSVRKSYESLEPGVYSQIPSVTQWQAPGPIITREQALTPPLEINRHEKEANQPLTRYRQKYPFPNSPNPGYPLPGHVLTYENTGPGSPYWQEYNLGPEWK